MVVSIFVFKKKTAYEVRISYWSSDGCSSDRRSLRQATPVDVVPRRPAAGAGKLLAEPGRRRLHDPEQRRLALGALAILGRGLGHLEPRLVGQTGRASCRARELQFVVISVDALSSQNKYSTSYRLHPTD